MSDSSTIQIKKAVRPQKPLKMVLDGLAGSGKTYTALRLAFQLGKKICVIDTEHGRASLYAGEVVDGKTWEFATIELDCTSVGWYIAAIDVAVASGADVIIIDSISPEWDSEDGILQVVEKGKKNAGGSFSAWNEGSKEHKRFINAILRIPRHTICTMRTKSQYVVEETINRQGKPVQAPRKVGFAPVQRDGIEYEFDICIRMDAGSATVTKSPGAFIENGYSEFHPGQEFAKKILDWLNLKPAAPEISEPVPAAAPDMETQILNETKKQNAILRQIVDCISEPVSEDAPGEVPEETPGIGLEYSPDDAFDQVIGLLKAGKITQKARLDWGAEAGLPPTLKEWKDLMTDEMKMDMIEAMTAYAQTGKFPEPMPF